MTCSNCYNQCTDIQSDKCVRYTGIEIPDLQINTGDTLLSVEQKLITYLLSALSGEGITPSVNTLCPLVANNVSGTSLGDILEGIIIAVCNLDTRVTDVTDYVDDILIGYNTGDCLVGVDETSNVHDVVQAIITKLCALNLSFTQLVANLPSDYVSISDLNSLIQSYLDSINAGTMVRDKMIPYVPYPYFADLGANFAADGTGLGSWEDVYICNGANSTPDLRGRVIVGTTTTPGLLAFPDATNPALPDNPTYVLGENSIGANNITLAEAELPAHTHANTVTATQPSHTHFTVANNTQVALTAATAISDNNSSGGDYQYTLKGVATTADLGLTNAAQPAITTTVTNVSVGSGQSHSNIQPVLAMHHIMYVP